MESSFTFLRREPLWVSNDDIAGILKKFPECLCLDVTERLRKNLMYPGTSWPAFKDAKRLKAALSGKPAIHRLSVGCGGGCESECNCC